LSEIGIVGDCFLNSLHQMRSLDPNALPQLIFKGRVTRGGHRELAHFSLRSECEEVAIWSLSAGPAQQLRTPLRFRREAFRSAGLANPYCAFRTAVLRGCYHQILGPHRYFAKLADVFC